MHNNLSISPGFSRESYPARKTPWLHVTFIKWVNKTPGYLTKGKLYWGNHIYLGFCNRGLCKNFIFVVKLCWELRTRHTFDRWKVQYTSLWETRSQRNRYAITLYYSHLPSYSYIDFFKSRKMVISLSFVNYSGFFLLQRRFSSNQWGEAKPANHWSPEDVVPNSKALYVANTKNAAPANISKMTNQVNGR